MPISYNVKCLKTVIDSIFLSAHNATIDMRSFKMFDRGNLVKVKGMGGEEAILRVWESHSRGLLLCTEEGYRKLTAGEEAAVVGFPMCDIVNIEHEEQQRKRVISHREKN